MWTETKMTKDGFHQQLKTGDRVSFLCGIESSPTFGKITSGVINTMERFGDSDLVNAKIKYDRFDQITIKPTYELVRLYTNKDQRV